MHYLSKLCISLIISVLLLPTSTAHADDFGCGLLNTYCTASSSQLIQMSFFSSRTVNPIDSAYVTCMSSSTLIRAGAPLASPVAHNSYHAISFFQPVGESYICSTTISGSGIITLQSWYERDILTNTNTQSMDDGNIVFGLSILILLVVVMGVVLFTTYKK